MTNKTQCPNCLTIYYITDEQFQKSKGKVRCGTCRQPFKARILSDAKPYDAERAQGSSNGEYHPEVNTNLEATQAADSSVDQEGTQATREPQSVESKAGDEQVKPEYSQYPDASSTAELGADIGEAEPPNVTAEQEQAKSNLAENLHSELSLRFDIEPPDDDAEALITQVDSLISERFSDDQNRAMTHVDENVSAADEDDFFLLKRRAQQSKLARWLGFPLLLLASILLTLALLSQLWYRQALPGLDGSGLAARLTPTVSAGAQWVEQTLAVDIPQRTDLSNLRLVSATVVPHPERASTTLLKVSLHNRSEIAQPYPWLELRLMDENGRLVARRALAPQDYLFNNRLPKLIKPRELRKVSIELLAFPQQAHGYELKIIRPDFVR